MTILRQALIALALCLSGSLAWVSPIAGHRAVSRNSLTKQFVDTISVENLTNHDEEGTLLAESIVRWLDSEWMPQEVHVQMAESAKASYISERESDKDDVMDIMMQVSTDLDKNWKEYDKDAFVNAWDIGNYVADYLTQRSGNEGCECSSEIF